MALSNITIPSFTTLIPVDTRTNNLKVLLLPTVSTNTGRMILFKDYYGTSSNSTFTISTTGTDFIDDTANRYTFSNSFGSMSFISDGLRSWRVSGLYTGGLTPGTFSPTQFAGLSLWLDAADTSTFTLSGASVTQWRDKSGNSRHAVGNLGTGAYSATGLNSLPTVQITASGNMVSPVAASTFSAGIFVFVVFQKTGANQTYDTVVTRVNGANSQPAPFDFYTSGTNTTTRLVGNGGTSAQISETITSVARRTTPTVLFQGVPGVASGSTLLWDESINGTLTNYTLGTSFTYGDTGTAIHLGTRGDNATKMIGNISEVLVYAASSFSISQRQQMEGYLAWKWGIQADLPVGHPYKSAAP